MPVEVQARLLDQSLETDNFIELIEQIVDERIEAGRKAARKLLGPQRKKPNRKG